MTTNKNYAVMRHASYSASTSNQEITQSGIQQIKRAAEILESFFKENNITEFQIWHSPQMRANNTAKLLIESVTVQCVTVLEKRFLNCDLESIQDNIPNEEIFTLLISHEPDIEFYIRKMYSYRPDVYNCDIYVGSEKLPFS